MPLIKGKGKKAISANIKELVTSKPGKTRAKGIATMVKKGMSPAKAKQRQAVAIAMSKSGMGYSKDRQTHKGMPKHKMEIYSQNKQIPKKKR